HHLHGLGNIRESENGIARPTAAGDARAVELHRLEEGPACRLDDPALDLVADSVGIDGLAAIHGGHCSKQPRGAVASIDADFDGNRDIRGLILVSREREAFATPGRATMAIPAEARRS